MRHTRMLTVSQRRANSVACRLGVMSLCTPLLSAGGFKRSAASVFDECLMVSAICEFRRAVDVQPGF